MQQQLISSPNIKHARLTSRKIASYEDVDAKIKKKLQELELANADLWTNPDYNKNEFVHSIFQYPAMMVPEVQRKIIDVIFQSSDRNRIKSMIDPFMGSSTSLVSSMHYGLDCYGQDINPLAILISKVRTSLVDTNLKRVAKQSAKLVALFREDDLGQIDVNFKGINKWFKKSVILELSNIRRAILLEPDLTIRRFFWANLAEVIRICSNDRTSTYKLHSRPLDEIENRQLSPLTEMAKQLEQSIKGYTEFKNFLRKKGRVGKQGYLGKIFISYGDSSNTLNFPKQEAQFAELLICSPPYGDNHTTVTYGQYSFLQLNWMDLDDIHPNIDKNCLISTAQIDSQSLGGKRSDPNVFALAKDLCALSPTFYRDFESFKTLDRVRLNKIVIFLTDLVKSIDNSISALKKDSYLIWTIGNRNVGPFEVNNNRYLQEFLEAKGCKFIHSVNRAILFKRMAKKNKDTALMNTEEILVLRKTL
jgi:hypothetical protein